jgi:hypothetical protein
MPLGGAVIGAVVGLTSLTVGAIQKSKAMKMEKDLAQQQMQNQVVIADKTNMANITIGQGHDIATVFGGTLQSSIAANAQNTTASINKQGNALVIVGMGIVVLSLAVIVMRKKSS